jgi:carbon storage regulator
VLVLSRKIGEVLVVGEGADRVEITVVDIRGDRARIGVTAKRETPVHRLEIAERIEKEKGK